MAFRPEHDWSNDMTNKLLTVSTRRQMLGLALALAAAGPAAAQTFQEIDWMQLVPKGWDPAKDLQNAQGKGGEGLAGLSDTDPRAQQMLEELRKIWDNAPTVPEMANRQVKLPGYLVPLDEGKEGLREFLLVPYFGACIHTPPPPSNQIVHARSAKPLKGLRSMDAVWASGRLLLERSDSGMGVASYALQIERVVPYK
jgi:hypothetical protein